jgi:hypothetical protein
MKFTATFSRQSKPGAEAASLLVVVVIGLLLVAGLWRLQTRPTVIAAALPSLQGQAALAHLKREGQYESLQQALTAARMKAVGAELRLEGEDLGAQYPQMINSTISQQAYLKASNTDLNDAFGLAVAVSGETVVVSTPNEDSNATGVNGNGSNNSATEAGAVYVFVRSGTSWTQQAYLKASNTGEFDAFGRSVALSGDTLVVGANGEDSNATGVNGDQSSNSAQDAGAVYVFVRSGTSWTQQAYLKASNTGTADSFGYSVAVSGDTVVVGAYAEDSGTTGINGNGSDNSAADAGAAYVFVRSGTNWTQQAYLKASNTNAGDVFGFSVAMSGETVVVGAWQEDSNATGVNGDQSNNSANTSGAAYVFVRSGANWTQQAYLKASNTEASDGFGLSVAASGNTIAIGAHQEASNATGVNGDQSNNSAGLAGAAYVFVRSGTSWTQQAYLKASNTDAVDNFGYSVAVSGETVVVGAYGEDSNATGITGDQSNNSATNAGAAYVFVRSGTSWAQQAYLKASNTGAGDFFGFVVAVSGGTVVVSAIREDSGAIGINGDQSNNGTTNSGAAYIFTSSSCPTITVIPANPTLPTGRAGVPYSQTFTQTGGAGTVNFSVSAGALPTGLTLTAGGVLSGTPTVFGTFNFTLRATDANLCTGERAYTLMVNPPCPTLTVNPATLPIGAVGTTYNQTLTATGGTAPYTFAVTTGSLPNGLMLASGGALTGTPTAAGTFNFTLTATDNTGCTGTRAYTVMVSGNGLLFYPLPAPVRLLDTRPGASPNACSQPDTPIAGQTSRLQPGRNLCTIPANAQALTGNVTTVDSGGGFLTLYPSDAQQPTVASTNYGVNEIINNVFTVGLGADGAFKIFANNTTDVVVDVTGYYAPPATGGLYFHPLPAPVRLLETRAGFNGCVTPGAPLAGNADSTQQAISACTGIPAATRAIVGNATTVGPQGGGFLTIFPADAVRPLVASSNFNTGQVVNGPFTVGLATNGQFKIYTTATTDLVVDVLGYYSPEANDANGVGLLFNPLPKPVRLLETRPGLPVGCFKPGVPLAGGSETLQTARGVCDGVTIPANALGVVGNATVVFPIGQGFLTLWPSTAARPLVATSNYNAGDVGNRHFIVGLGQADGAFKIYTHATTDLVIDLSGYFAP